MNYYPFHIGDYLANTAHLEPMEDLAYRRMIDLYYLREGPLPESVEEVARLIRLKNEVDSVRAVLTEFFKLCAGGWVHDRCESEILVAQSKRTKAQESAAKRWDSERNANAVQTHSEGNAPNPNPNPNPNPKKKPLKAITSYSDEFEIAWNEYPKKSGHSKKAAFKAWSARISAGVSPEVMQYGVRRYALYCSGSGTEQRFIKHAATFFGTDEHYLSDWTPDQAQYPPGKPAKFDPTAYVNQGRKQTGAGNEQCIDGEAQRVA